MKDSFVNIFNEEVPNELKGIKYGNEGLDIMYTVDNDSVLVDVRAKLTTKLVIREGGEMYLGCDAIEPSDCVVTNIDYPEYVDKTAIYPIHVTVRVLGNNPQFRLVVYIEDKNVVDKVIKVPKPTPKVDKKVNKEVADTVNTIVNDLKQTTNEDTKEGLDN